MKPHKSKRGDLSKARGLAPHFSPYAHEPLAWIIIRDSVGTVSQALKSAWDAKRLDENVYGKRLIVDDYLSVPLRLKGHKWTSVVSSLTYKAPVFSEELAKQVSQALKTRVLFFCYEKVSGTLMFIVFDNGNPVEVLGSDGSEGGELIEPKQFNKLAKLGWPVATAMLKLSPKNLAALKASSPKSQFYFYSSLRNVAQSSVRQENLIKFLDETLRFHDAYLFCPKFKYETGGLTISDPSWSKSDVERADLISLEPDRKVSWEHVRRENAANEAVYACARNYAIGTRRGRLYVYGSQRPEKEERREHIKKSVHYLKAFRRLLKDKIKIQDRWMCWAARSGNIELLETLVEAGGSVKAQDEHGRKLIKLAKEAKKPEVVRLLTKLGG